LIRAKVYSNFVKYSCRTFRKKDVRFELCTLTDSSKIRETSSFQEEWPRIGRYMIRCFSEIAIHSRELRKHVYAV
jgi:hypothetical protein